MASSINIPAASLPAVLSGSDIEKLVMDGLLVQCHVTLSLNTVLLSCKNKSNSNNKMETLSSHIGDEILINVFNSHAKAFKKLQNNIVTLIMSRYPTTEHVSIRRFMTNSNIKDHNIKFFAITYKEVVIASSIVAIDAYHGGLILFFAVSGNTFSRTNFGKLKDLNKKKIEGSGLGSLLTSVIQLVTYVCTKKVTIYLQPASQDVIAYWERIGFSSTSFPEALVTSMGNVILQTQNVAGLEEMVITTAVRFYSVLNQETKASGTDVKAPLAGKRKRERESFDSMFDQWKNYCAINNTKVVRKEEKKLSRWVHQQRLNFNDYNKRKIQAGDEDEIQKDWKRKFQLLSNAGFQFTPREATWDDMYELFRDYVNEHNTIRVTNTKETKKLLDWTYQQQLLYRNPERHLSEATRHLSEATVTYRKDKLQELKYEPLAYTAKPRKNKKPNADTSQAIVVNSDDEVDVKFASKKDLFKFSSEGLSPKDKLQELLLCPKTDKMLHGYHLICYYVGDGCEVHYEDFFRYKNERFVTSHLLMAYFSLLKKHCTATNKAIMLFNTYFIDILEKDPDRLPAYRNRRTNELHNFWTSNNLNKKILIPCHVDETHYCLVVVCFTEFTISLFDSLNNNDRRTGLLEKIKKYIVSVDRATDSVHQKNWSIQDCSDSILKQDDGHSCGYFTCWYAYDHVMGGSATCTKLKDIKETTKMIKETVMCSTLADDIIPFEF